MSPIKNKKQKQKQSDVELTGHRHLGVLKQLLLELSILGADLSQGSDLEAGELLLDRGSPSGEELLPGVPVLGRLRCRRQPVGLRRRHHKPWPSCRANRRLEVVLVSGRLSIIAVVLFSSEADDVRLPHHLLRKSALALRHRLVALTNAVDEVVNVDRVRHGVTVGPKDVVGTRIEIIGSSSVLSEKLV